MITMMRETSNFNIIVGSDHAGFALKERIKKHLVSIGFRVKDVGTFSKDPVDYPKYAIEVAREAVASGGASKGILFCGSGAGMSIAANKVKGARCVDAFDEYTAKKSREDNNANVLSLAARVVNFDQAKKIVDIWLNARFSEEERHRRRLKQIEDFERKWLK